MKKNSILICLILIIFLGFFLRIFNLSGLPGSLNEDEVALGYNAYSLLKTGTDEHGKFLPIALESFGDWKLPVYPLISIIPIGILGLTEFAIRLPSALAGTVSIFLMYAIANLLFRRKYIGLFAALFFALSPWTVYFSHAAYEVNLATALFLTGFLLYLFYYRHGQKNIWLPIFGTASIGLTFFTYPSYALFVPLFLFVIFLFIKKSLTYNKTFFISLGVFIIFFIASYISTLTVSTNKVSTLLIFNDKNVIYNRVEKLRGDTAAKNQKIEKVLYNKYFGATYQIAQNYINSFSPSFLFDKGGEKLEHNLYGIGNLYLFDVLLLFIGFAAMFWQREKALPILLAWLVVGPIPSALTKDAPNSTRLFLLLPLFILLCAYAAETIRKICVEKKNFSVIGVILIFLYAFNVLYFLDAYYVHFNAQRVRFWHYGYKQAVELSNKYPNYHIVMRGPENFPYIYFLFYSQYNPRQFQKEVSYYPPTDEGFLYVKQFGRFSFPNKIDYNHLQPKTIYIDDTSLGDKNHAILLPSGEPVLGYTVIP